MRTIRAGILPVLLLAGAVAPGSPEPPIPVTFVLAAPSQAGRDGPPGVRGSIPPLSWETSLPLTDEDGDGVFTARVLFESAVRGRQLAYKYILGDSVWELGGVGDRIHVIGSTPPGPETWGRISLPADLAPPTPALLERDYNILRDALLALHPALHRYLDTTALEARFRDLRAELLSSRDLRSAYLAVSRFTAALRCGHTYANFLNQSGLIRQEVFFRRDRFPAAFRFLDGRMIITGDATAQDELPAGTEILAINGRPVREILDSLLLLVKGDGSNDAKRLSDLQVTGRGGIEPFDVYYPLLFPSGDTLYSCRVRSHPGGVVRDVRTPALTSAVRTERLAVRNGPLPSADEEWSFRMVDDSTGLLRIGTFVVWRMQRDWRGFLDSAFALLAERNASHLILDIRGNEGGADEVTELLLRRLLTAPPPPDSMRSFVRYVRVPDTLGVHLSTWDDAIRDLSGLVVPAAGGMHELKQDRIPPQPDASPFRGRLSMLVDEANSSATFYLADIVRRTGRGQLIGRTTGGNRKGMNGGRFFFLRLPGTGIEVDIPLVGGFPQASRPDGGIEPDIRVPLLPEDLLGGRDRDLEAALQTRLVE